MFSSPKFLNPNSPKIFRYSSIFHIPISKSYKTIVIFDVQLVEVLDVGVNIHHGYFNRQM